jgi:hypothetical protein
MTDAPEWSLPMLDHALGWVSVQGMPVDPRSAEADGGFWSQPPAGADEPPLWVPVTDEQIEQAMRDTAAAIVNVIPYVGDIKGFIELFHGEDLISRERLAWWERILGAAGLTEAAAGKFGWKAVAAVAEPLSQADDVLDRYAMARLVVDGPAMAEAVETLRSGADIETLDWRRETTAVVHTGVVEAARLVAAVQRTHPLDPAVASDVTEILAKSFVRQAQMEGLLPRRLQVIASPAEGGVPGETIDLWDPKTGVAWSLTPPGFATEGFGDVGRTMQSGGARVQIVEVVPIPRPQPHISR